MVTIKSVLLTLTFGSFSSIGYGEDCCLRKQVGESFYTFQATETVDGTGCHSDCVYSRDGESQGRYCFAPGNLTAECQSQEDSNRTIHAIYSGLSSLHSAMKKSLTTEQLSFLTSGRTVFPPTCPSCDPINYCWHGQCVGIGNLELPTKSHTSYVNNINDLQKYIHLPNVFSSLSDACSDARIECYGECLPKVLNELAACLLLPNWKIPGCLFLAVGKIVDDCKECGCQLIFLIFPHLKPILQSFGICKSINKPEIPGEECNRDCNNSPPQTCLFNFVLESVQTNADGRRADGRIRSALAYNGKIPGPPIVMCEGDDLKVHFTNKLDGNLTAHENHTTTLHFHGIREKSRPWSDGVPKVTQCPILPDGSFSYGFNTDIDGAPPGTYWYHSHVGAQRTNGAYGALIIKPSINSFIDNASNTMVLQEWYASALSAPKSILINGKGRLLKKSLTADEDEITKFLEGQGGIFEYMDETDFDGVFTTNYEEFDVEEGKSYRFRIIGAISQNVPLQVSIEGHAFTAIATDSLDIQPVTDLNSIWLAAGERYDIIIKTKASKEQDMAYKIKVFGFVNPDHPDKKLCTIAWLRYPGQTIDYNYIPDAMCSNFTPSSGKTLNPVPNKYADWVGSPDNGKVFIKDIKAKKNEPTINYLSLANLNTHYYEFKGLPTFNEITMAYPDIPFLLQDSMKSERCGSKCVGKVEYTTEHNPYLGTTCTQTPPPSHCNPGAPCCQHVTQQPWAPGYWAETVLINNNDQQVAHPIHQHGGWYWVVGMGKYDHPINRTFIMKQDSMDPLPRNFLWAPAKDTLQIPQQGYAIIRTKLDNAGTWIFHCHINYHVTHGMAMVLQIGELGNGEISSLLGQNWCTGPLEVDASCKASQSLLEKEDQPAISWYLGMTPVNLTVKSGTDVTFTRGDAGNHNVNELTKDKFVKCEVSNTTAMEFPYKWTAPTTPGTYYLACGFPGHCQAGMRAAITVVN